MLKDEVKHELVQCADVFSDDHPAGSPLKQNHEFHIQPEEGAKPRRSGVYRLSEYELLDFKKQLADSMRKGFT